MQIHIRAQILYNNRRRYTCLCIYTRAHIYTHVYMHKSRCLIIPVHVRSDTFRLTNTQTHTCRHHFQSKGRKSQERVLSPHTKTWQEHSHTQTHTHIHIKTRSLSCTSVQITAYPQNYIYHDRRGRLPFLKQTTSLGWSDDAYPSLIQSIWTLMLDDIFLVYSVVSNMLNCQSGK